MKYFYDCEFLEDGKTIELISIGIAAEDGREFYAVSEEIGEGYALYDRIRGHKWLMDNVVPNLPLARPVRNTFGGRPSFCLDDASNTVMPRRMIRNGVRDFILSDDGEVELWADFGAYDHVALAQLFGPMIKLPPGMPMFTHEFAQAWRAAGQPVLPVQDPAQVHNALEDARHLRRCFQALYAPKLDVWTEPPAQIEKTWGDDRATP